jgi:hypothetical protein
VEKKFRAGHANMTKLRMRIACWIPKARNTHSGYVILIAFPMQQWLHERVSMLRYTSFSCLVLSKLRSAVQRATLEKLCSLSNISFAVSQQ